MTTDAFNRQRIAILHMAIGFSVVAIAAAAGSFIAHDLSEGYLRDKVLLDSWQMTLLKSAHGHTNLFGLLHIGFGLTMRFSRSSWKRQKWEGIGLGCGTFAMAVLMLIRSYGGPTENLDMIEIATGAFLSCALLALGSHSFGLAEGYWKTVPGEIME